MEEIKAVAKIQTLVRVETQFSEVIELLQVGPDFRIDSRQVAPKIGIEHSNFVETLAKYQTELEHFGSLPFETAVKKREVGATHQKYVMLNRNQVLFAITLSRNTPQVINWKMALIEALDVLDRQVSGHRKSYPLFKVRPALSPEELELKIIARMKQRQKVTARDLGRALKTASMIDIHARLKALIAQGIVEEIWTGRTYLYALSGQKQLA